MARGTWTVYPAKTVRSVHPQHHTLRTCLQLTPENISQGKFGRASNTTRATAAPRQGLQSEEDYRENLDMVKSLLRETWPGDPFFTTARNEAICR